ncbi:MAG TPA: hypothetical protein VMT03_07695 [Polyangia bacterium]|nr:hypothetical protein [Polyangia bacterium]
MKRTLLMIGTVAMGLTGAGCVVDPGPDGGGGTYGGDCLPTLYIDYEIQNASGAPVTCAGAGAVSVQATVDGVMFPQSCRPGSSFGQIAVPLQGLGKYNATIDLFDSKGNPLAPAQQRSFNITSCGDTEPNTPAILVVTPPSST